MDVTRGSETTDSFPPEGVNLDRPSIARIYDYYLGGDANWAIDREFGDKVKEAFPLAVSAAKANRQFLFRVVRHLMRLGVRQFVDLGAGLPTMDHTHSVADAYEPGTARVVYVDNEPVAVAHSQILLEQQGDPRRHTAINADLRAPGRLWQQVLDTGLIDLSQPVGLLMIAVLHVQQLDEHGRDMGADVVARYRELLPSGSYLAISHATNEGVPPAIAEQMVELKAMYDQSSSPVIWRTHQEIAALFGDFELVEPGLTWTPSWHPEESVSRADDPVFAHPGESIAYAGIARKP
ncbi:MAG TPA: SAM-dependent methyltransferase [Pseudonocardiaceae bacterium]|nr:SAM-dependent methyltransferase [Pseudonocardiaceae bacterium]